jgi:hypothetical protein
MFSAETRLTERKPSAKQEIGYSIYVATRCQHDANTVQVYEISERKEVISHRRYCL